VPSTLDVGGGLHSQSLDCYWQTKQYRKIHKLNTTQKSKQRKMHVQQNNTTLVQSPLTIVDQEMRWAYST